MSSVVVPVVSSGSGSMTSGVEVLVSITGSVVELVPACPVGRSGGVVSGGGSPSELGSSIGTASSPPSAGGLVVSAGISGSD